MRAIKLNAQVTSDHTLHLALPEDIEEGPVEVIILVGGLEEAATPRAGVLADFLARPAIDHRFVRCKDAIDHDLRAERDRWE